VPSCMCTVSCSDCLAHDRFKQAWDGQVVFYVQQFDKCLEKSRDARKVSRNNQWLLVYEVLAELGMGSSTDIKSSKEDPDDNSEGDLEDNDTAKEDDDNGEESEELGGCFSCWEKWQETCS